MLLFLEINLKFIACDKYSVPYETIKHLFLTLFWITLSHASLTPQLYCFHNTGNKLLYLGSFSGIQEFKAALHRMNNRHLISHFSHPLMT